MDLICENNNKLCRCEDGKLINKKSCDFGMKFSVADQCCKAADQVSCTYIHCVGSLDGYFITPGSRCKSYYTCADEKINNYECPEGYAFDNTGKTCSRSGGNCYELTCTGRTNGLYPDITHGCQRFYLCEGGQLKSVGGCPTGFLFSGSQCYNSSEVTCEPAERSSIKLLLLATDICIGLRDGAHYGTDDYCQTYVLCKSGIKIAELQCPNSQRFDGRKCVSASLVSCKAFCSDKRDGVHANVRNYCREYIECLNNNIVSISKCPEGFLHNGNKCVSSSSYECPTFESEQRVYKNHCLYLNDGVHTDYLTSCREYFYCYRGELTTRNSCLFGMVWDGTECVPVGNYTCDDPQFSPECSSRGDGLFTDNSKQSNCKKYYYCYEGLQVRLECRKNYVFNGVNCVPVDLYKCPIIDVDCHNKSDGYYTVKNSECQSYYFCSNDNKITYVCPNAEVFNGSECVSINMFKCPGSKSDSCHSLNNGYFPDVDDNCETYFYCFNGKKIMTFKCDLGEIFDGNGCVTSGASTCREFPKVTCQILKDGMYVKQRSNCKEYFQCAGKKMAGFKKCPGDLSFNGTTCITMENEYCESVVRKQTEDLSKCNTVNNGFYPDLISGCKTYFYCIDGIKTTLSCPLGKLFNGEICVDDFHCPSFNIIE